MNDACVWFRKNGPGLLMGASQRGLNVVFHKLTALSATDDYAIHVDHPEGGRLFISVTVVLKSNS